MFDFQSFVLKPVFRKLAPYSLGTTLYQTPLNALKNKAFFIV